MGKLDKLIAEQRATLGATRRVYAKDRKADYGYTTDVIEGIMGNLGTTVAGRAAQLGTQNERQMRMLLARRYGADQGAEAKLDRGIATASRNYGSAAVGASAPLVRQAQGHIAAGRAEARGNVQAGWTMQAGGKAVMDILGAGVQEANAAAKYQTAEALAYRAKEDAKLIADMAMQQKQAQLDFHYWKKQQDYLAGLEEGANGSMQGLGQVTETTGTASWWMRNYLGENPATTAAELLAAYETDQGTLSEGERAVMLQIARNVRGSVNEDGTTIAGYTREDEVQDLINVIHTLYPNMKGAKLDAALSALLQTKYGPYAGQGVAAAEGSSDNLNPALGAGKGGAQGGNVLESDVVVTTAQGEVRIPAGTPWRVDENGRQYINWRGQKLYPDGSWRFAS